MKYLLFRNDHLCVQEIVLSRIVVAIVIGEIAAADFQPDAMTFTETTRHHSEATLVAAGGTPVLPAPS
jgi:hypothetical protein